VSQTEKKVLVMDDEEIVADIAQQMLLYLGYDAHIAEAGEQAVKDYKEAFDAGNPYALVIMDLNIPQGMGGIEAVRHILEIDKNAKVVVSSGYSGDPIMQEYSEYGFVASIGKPFDIKGLQDVIQIALQ
jgi:two-component system, cell cycle sensor histidine kinase and response regulator CckA